MGVDEIAGVVGEIQLEQRRRCGRGTPLALMDETGTMTSATVTWAANSSWEVPITDQAGNTRMMKSYLDTSSTSVTTVTVDGLVPGTYDVYIYADGDNRTFARTADYTISGPGFTATSRLTDPPGTNSRAPLQQRPIRSATT